MRLELHSELEQYRTQLEAIALPAARIRAKKQDSGIVGSRFGGTPFMPSGFVWPTVRDEQKKGLFRKSVAVDRPLTFLAQINFAEVAHECPELYELRWGMPSQGLFQVFYDVEVQPWGFDDEDSTHWKFFWYPSFEVNAHKTQSGPSCPPQAHGMTFAPFLTLPEDADKQLDMYEEDGDLLPDYERVEPQHCLGGWPAPVQDAPFYEIPPDAGKADSIAAKTKLEKAWRLVLQIDSDEDLLSYMWGDMGMLYIGVRETDLRTSDLGNPWLVLQCG